MRVDKALPGDAVVLIVEVLINPVVEGGVQVHPVRGGRGFQGS